jgi:hypothetical protein
VPVLVILGLVRAVALLRRGTGATWRDALGAFFIWQSTSLVVARASVLGLFAKKAVFLRTPKTSEAAKWYEALRSNWAESTLALLGFAGIAAALTKPTQLSGPLLAALLLFPTLGMAAAPVNSWAARRASLPQWLRARRSSEFRRDRSAFTAGLATGGLVAVVGVVAAVAALLFTPTQHPVTTPNLVAPAQGSAPATAPATTPAASPSSTPTTTPSATPSSSSPAPTPTPTTTTPTTAPTTTPTTPAAPATTPPPAAAPSPPAATP